MSTTTQLTLDKPARGTVNWDTNLNSNFDIIDGLFDTGPVLKVAKGGSGLAVYAIGDLLYASGTTTLARLAAGATTKILVGGGAAAPVWTEATGTGAPVRAGSPTFTTQITTPIIALTGGQIAFPATAVPSADANTLDDYEEGTFTVTFTVGGGSITINTSFDTMEYTKIGRMVAVRGQIKVDSVSSPTGVLLVSGLPFVNSAGSETSAISAVAVHCSNLEATAATWIDGFVQAATNYIVLYHFAAGVQGDMASDVKAASIFTISATYFV